MKFILPQVKKKKNQKAEIYLAISKYTLNDLKAGRNVNFQGCVKSSWQPLSSN